MDDLGRRVAAARTYAGLTLRIEATLDAFAHEHHPDA